MKKLFGCGAILVALIAVGAFFALRMMGAFSGAALEHTLAFIFQVDANVDKVSLNPASTALELRGLSLGNPDGYGHAESFSFESATAKLVPGTAVAKRPGITELTIRGMRVTLEFEGTETNLAKMIENASRLRSRQTGEPSDIPIYFEKIVVEAGTVQVIAPIINQPIAIPVPTLEIIDLGTKDEPITAAEASLKFAQALLVAVTNSAADKIPDSLKDTLKQEANEAMQGAKDILKQKALEQFDRVREGLGGTVDGLRNRALDRLNTPPNQ